ncbi:hypothetical protein, partial [Vibrio parahaemolyticus]|uniref:hypothetical protein n=1 Tax=Vibrio parahaemolyticus TaxID=670 RepID=UPI001BB08393
VSDIVSWPDELFHDSILEVFKGVSLASGSSRTGLHLDATSLLETISSSCSDGSQLAIFDRTVYIDIESDWDSISHSGLDSEKLEKAMYCGRSWIVCLAGNLLLNLHNSEGLSRL